MMIMVVMMMRMMMMKTLATWQMAALKFQPCIAHVRSPISEALVESRPEFENKFKYKCF